jgi:hypothetical protein
LPQQAIAGQRFGVGVCLLPGRLHQAHGMVLILPGVQARPSDSTTPRRGNPWPSPPEGWPKQSSGHEPFFSKDCGSGLVLQSLARFQLVLRRLRARRTRSSETGAEMIPCSKLTWAPSSRVQVPRSLPNSRGLRCSRSLSRWAPSWVKAVRQRCGRDDPSCKTVSPAALKPWITLRTVWSSQPRRLAMAGARGERAEASSTWQRRNTKASDERNPAWIWRCSSSVIARIKIGVLMPASRPHCLSPLVDLP